MKATLLRCTLLAGFVTACVTSHAAGAQAPVPPAATPMLVGYLPDYKGISFTDFAKKIDFSHMTHLNLAFGNPPKCDGLCTAQSDMKFTVKGQSDADVNAIVAAAHAAGVKVLLSIGGGGGDQLILQFYNAGLSKQLVDSLDSYIHAHQLDGADVDIEDPSNMGAPFGGFVTTLAGRLHPEGKIVTAAVAKYLQDSMPDAALHQFDFINVMVYSSLSAAQTALAFYAVDKKVSRSQIVLGVPFFGSTADDTREEDYQTILAAYPNAWRVDMVGGGALDDGQAFHYVGEATMAAETVLGKSYGGVMIWELMGDGAAPHSLLQVVHKNL